MNKRDGVVAAQAIMAATANPDLSVDGVWGPKSSSTFQRLPPSVSGMITRVLSSMKVPLPRMQAEGRWISQRAVTGMVRDASRETGISAEFLWYLLNYEPHRTTIAGEVHYNAASIRGSYRGLTQMGVLAWTDAISAQTQRVGRSDLGSIEANWADPQKSIRAAAWFAVKNIGYLKNAGYKGPLTNELLYAMHNQGVSFIESAKSGGVGKYFSEQSDKAQEILVVAANQLRAGGPLSG